MKKLLIFSIGVLAGVLAVVMTIGVHHAAAPKRIAKVFEANRVAAAGLRQARGLAPTVQAFKSYDRGLDYIDADDCPTDFRLAWFDYVQAVHHLASLGGLDAILSGAEMIGAGYTRSPFLAEDAVRRLKRDNILARFERLERIAIKHGVAFRPIR